MPLLNERHHHAYIAPVEGYCTAYVNLGPRYKNRVRCSRKAKPGTRYCGTHLKRNQTTDTNVTQPNDERSTMAITTKDKPEPVKPSPPPETPPPIIKPDDQ